MGLMLAEPGYHTCAFVEWEDWPRTVLIAAQRAGYFAPAPIWDDLRSFDARRFHGAFDTLLAGYPCQPFSAAGKRGGAGDPRHLWPEVARVIGGCRPEWVFLENVAGHVTLGLETVLRELWRMGYTPAAGLFSAAEVGAPHQRLRVFILAHSGRAELEGQFRGQHHPNRRQVQNGHPALPGGAGLHPPGPGDHAGWAAVLATRPISRPLWASMTASHGRVVSRRILKGRSRRRLNPLFVGWLMGWPIGHVLCACSATEFIRWQRHMRGALSQLPMASDPWIWRPTKAAQRPAQMDFLDGLQS